MTKCHARIDDGCKCSESSYPPFEADRPDQRTHGPGGKKNTRHVLPIRTLLHRQCECTTSPVLQLPKLCTQPRRVRSQIPELLYCSLARRPDRTSALAIPSSLIQHPVRPCADVLSRGKFLANAHAASIEHTHRLCSFRRGSDQPRRHHFTTGYDLPAVEHRCRTRA